MAVGIPPKYQDIFETKTFTKKEAFSISVEALKKLEWSISSKSEDLIKARTNFSFGSFGEEVTIRINRKEIEFESKCMGMQLFDWGKNKENFTKFVSTYKRTKLNPEKIPINSYTENTEAEPETPEVSDTKTNIEETNNSKNISSFLIPGNKFFVTPVLMYINIIIFLLMISSGVDIFMPDNESLLQWGANLKHITIEGDYWRLFSSCFIHIGVLHLIMNMYALVFIGILLEPYLGKIKFFAAYILCGIFSSTISMYWNDDLTISAGASGAIFGMYGLFLAMLSTKTIEKSKRHALLVSIGIFVFYNLVNGVNGDVDNAAHIGGLVCGALIGFSYIPSIKRPESELVKYVTVVAVSIVTISLSSLVYSSTTPSDISIYVKKMDQFYLLEERGMAVYDITESYSNNKILETIKEQTIPAWEEALELAKEIENLDIPEDFKEDNIRLQKYCELRIESFKLMYRAIDENTDKYDSEINNYITEIDKILEESSKAQINS